MARVKSNLKEVASKISGISNDVKILAEVGQFIVKRIQGFTRLGYSLYGTPVDPKSNPLKPLSPAYIRYRKRLSLGIVKHGPTTVRPILDDSFKATRSQLTVTGQLLKSIQYTAMPQEKSVKVFVSSTRRTDGENNRNVAKDVSKNGRPFMGIDKKGIETIKIRYIKALKRRFG